MTRPTLRTADRRALRPDECRAIVAIAAYRIKHGRGPSWRAVGRAVGWKPPELRDRLHPLQRAGLVRFTLWEPGSLDVTPEAPTIALRRLRELRELGERL